MGKTSYLVNSQKEVHKGRHNARTQRSHQESNMRRSDNEKSERQIAKCFSARVLPSEQEESMLLSQIDQTLRVPTAINSLLNLVYHLAESVSTTKEYDATVNTSMGAKRTRENEPNNDNNTSLAHLGRILENVLSVFKKEQVEENEDILASFILDENAGNFLSILLRTVLQCQFSKHDTKADTSIRSNVNSLIDVVLKVFDSKNIVGKNQMTARLLGSIVQYGNDQQKDTVLMIIFSLVKTNYDGSLADGSRTISSLLQDKFLVNTLLKLIEFYRIPTITKLNKYILSIETPSITEPKEGARVINDVQLLKLVTDRVAGNVIQSWVDDTNKEYIFFNILGKSYHLNNLLTSKRGTKFLAKLLESKFTTNKTIDENASKLALAMLNRVLNTPISATVDNHEPHINLNIVTLSMDIDGNYLVQKIFSLLPICTVHRPKEAQEIYKRLLAIFDAHNPSSTFASNIDEKETAYQHNKFARGGYKRETNAKSSVPVTSAYLQLAVNAIGCHTLIAFVDAVASASNVGVLDLSTLVDRIFKPSSVITQLMRDQYGGLVVRRIVACPTGAESKKGSILGAILAIAEPYMEGLIYDVYGNLTVQQIIIALTTADRYSFYCKNIKSHIVDMSQNQHAAHVVVSLFETADAKLIKDLIINLKDHVVSLAQHVNGRFVVEKLIPHSSDVRELLLRNFMFLSQAKGAQHVLCGLWSTLDNKAAAHLVNKLIMPNVKTLSCNQSGTLVLQKLLQASQAEDAQAAPAKASLCRLAYSACVVNTSMKNELLRDFWGKFVVHVLTSASQPK